MPNPKPSDDFRNISILAKGPVLAAITEQATRDGISLGKAAAQLVIKGIQAAPPVAIAIAPAPMPTDLATVPLADLLAEVGVRVEQANALRQAEARAIAAEQRLRAVTELLAGSPA